MAWLNGNNRLGGGVSGAPIGTISSVKEGDTVTKSPSTFRRPGYGTEWITDIEEALVVQNGNTEA